MYDVHSTYCCQKHCLIRIMMEMARIPKKRCSGINLDLKEDLSRDLILEQYLLEYIFIDNQIHSLEHAYSKTSLKSLLKRHSRRDLWLVIWFMVCLKWRQDHFWAQIELLIKSVLIIDLFWFADNSIKLGIIANVQFELSYMIDLCPSRTNGLSINSIIKNKLQAVQALEKLSSRLVCGHYIL